MLASGSYANGLARGRKGGNGPFALIRPKANHAELAVAVVICIRLPSSLGPSTGALSLTETWETPWVAWTYLAVLGCFLLLVSAWANV